MAGAKCVYATIRILNICDRTNNLVVHDYIGRGVVARTLTSVRLN
ncbi:protein of unknown function [Moritella yayanosii]|uniref:Uncharacterized protein n=1 Tax=Moritella yayanosii TaxID=69539 RepID=A0A330LP06_9GAMM|nr:protein of unknown function [Moritella yayanosii]